MLNLRMDANDLVIEAITNEMAKQVFRRTREGIEHARKVDEMVLARQALEELDQAKRLVPMVRISQESITEQRMDILHKACTTSPNKQNARTSSLRKSSSEKTY